jgi:predicted CXXCH cytochrome family protein
MMKQIIFLNLCIIILLTNLDMAFAEVITPKNPNSAKGCAICHFRWIDTFFVEGKGTDLVDYTAEKVEASPKMCMSCHDGSVMDSRERLANNNGHKTDIVPPAGMKIPEVFPLDEAGKIQCSTCHTAHGVSSDPASGETIFLRTSNKDSAMCRMCHSDKDGITDKKNHITGIVKKEIPEKLVSFGAHTTEKRDVISCETCHTAHGSRVESYLIESAKGSVLCFECHSDKEAFTPDGKRRASHIVNVEPVNAKIPEELLKSGAKLGFNGTIICQSCHKIHNSKTEKNLLVFENIDNTAICLTCHPDKHYTADTKHNLVYSAPEEKNLQGQTVKEVGVCSSCHLPHKAARKPYGDGGVAAQNCLSCHSEGNIAESSKLKGTQHLMETASLEKMTKEGMTLPLYNKSGIQEKTGAITCLTCHDPHKWSANSEKGEIRKDVKGDRTTSFLRKQSPDICKECHKDKFDIANSKHDLLKVAPNEKNILNETPQESGLCGTCHQVHNTQEQFLWGRETSMTEDQPNQKLCLDCHNNEGMANKKVIKDYSHPIDIALSDKNKEMKTSLPLFDSKGKFSQSGLIKCATCHDPHRWNPTNPLAEPQDDTDGDATNSFLRLETSPSPQLCKDCHQKEASVEKTGHDLLIKSPSSKNIAGKTPLASGTCGVCHLIHNSTNQLKLWVQDLGNGNSVTEKMCNACHSKNGSAADKVPLIASHPEDIIVTNIRKNTKASPDYFPIFNPASGELVTSGSFSCPSCHNVHQWDSHSSDKGQGGDKKGDATNNFLRMKAEDLLCMDCHGPGALYRYLNYHSPDNRKNAGD